MASRTNAPSTECFTCQPLEEYLSKADAFSSNLSSALQGPMWTLFLALVGLWAVVTGIKLALGMTGSKPIVTDLLFISITGILLGAQGPGLISAVFDAALTIMSESSAVAFQVAGGTVAGGSYTGISALAASGEEAITKVLHLAAAILGTTGWTDPMMPAIYALLLVLPYILLLILYVAQAVTAIFRLLMVAIFAPWLSLTFAFGYLRAMTMTGLKTALAAILVLFAATAALALTISGVNSINIDTSPTGGELSNFATISNPEFLVMIVMGWIGAALIAEGTSIANSIAGTALSGGAAGMIATGTMAAPGAVIAATRARSVAGVLGARGAENLTGGAKAAYDRKVNANRPPPPSGGSVGG